MYRTIFIELPNIRFYENPLSRSSLLYAFCRTDGRTDRHDEHNRRISTTSLTYWNYRFYVVLQGLESSKLRYLTSLWFGWYVSSTVFPGRTHPALPWVLATKNKSSLRWRFPLNAGQRRTSWFAGDLDKSQCLVRAMLRWQYVYIFRRHGNGFRPPSPQPLQIQPHPSRVVLFWTYK